MSDFVDRTAELDKYGEDDDSPRESDDELDGDTAAGGNHTSRRRNDSDNGDEGSVEDSSEEDEDDDEEEMAKVREGFIVDDDEEDEGVSDGERERRRRRRRKRRRKEMSEGAEDGLSRHLDDEELDEEDLDLVLENTGVNYRREEDRSSKRQKRIEDGLTDIFADEEKEDDDVQQATRRTVMDEFEGFIEEDEFSDEEPQRDLLADSRKPSKPGRGPAAIPGVDEEQVGEIFEIFGDGEEYAWALEAEEMEAAEEYDEAKPLTELKDVFEPSELAERMLTDEDNAIRAKDEPERFQIMRKAFATYELSEDEYVLEENWLVSEMVSRKSNWLIDHPDLDGPLRRAVRKVLEFLVKDQLEVPFIWQHRRDYLLHEHARDGAAAASDEFSAEPLLLQDDLWLILQLDIKFHSIVEKKHSADRLLKALGVKDSVFDDFLAHAETLQDYQDCWDYLQFRYSARIKDMAVTQPNGHTETEDGETNSNGATIHASVKRPNSKYTSFERIRSGNVYNIVRAFGITAEQFGLNFAEDQKLHFTEDPSDFPLDLADKYTQPDPQSLAPPLYDDSDAAFNAAKGMFAEEIFHDLQTRNFLRKKIIRALVRLNVYATEKGKKTIDETHPFYHFKYARNLEIKDILDDPETFLEILHAESQGLVDLRFKLFRFDAFFNKVLQNFLSDNVSDIATAWNNERKSVLRMAMDKLVLLMCREIREDLRTQCQTAVGLKCRAALLQRLDQAPYKPVGFELGTTPRVLAVSNGMGEPGKDATVCVFLDDQGRVLETMKLGDVRDESFRTNLVEIVKRRKPDVIGMAGFTVAANRLRKEILDVIANEALNVTADDDSGNEEPIKLVWVNDEVARLYQNSPRAMEEFAELAPLARYCIALARYMQSPLLEYAAMGSGIVSIEFHRLQTWLPQDLVRDMLDSAFIDMVNLVGVEINEAIKVPYVANLLQYVSGLGPRKASGMLKAIAAGANGYLNDRYELVTKQIAGKNIFMNCASFLRIPWEEQDAATAAYRNSEMTEILDSTRIHPEDYELARKMAADALELDEEDLVDLDNQGGVVAQLMDDDPEKLNELILEEYAEELLKNFNQRKRATLEMIKEELQRHYEELRKPFKVLTEEQVFTMLTGETEDTLAQGMVVPVNIRKVADRYLVARLACGIDGNVTAMEMTSRTDMPYPSALFYYGQTVRALIKHINYGTFQAELSLVEEAVEDALKHAVLPYGKKERDRDKWDEYEEDRDRATFAEKREKEQRAARVIKHRLFKPFSAKQAEEYLAPMQRGDLVIRPSSKGYDHIAITWKVAEGVYQHIAVLELEKDNDYSLGKALRVADSKYSDLDELIFMHVQAMARKVDEMMNSEKFQRGTMEDVERWLTTYTEANPRRSNYAFCLDTKNAGYFCLCFKAGLSSKVVMWPVKVIPNGYQLLNAIYPDVQQLCNGFKMQYAAKMQKKR
ncbi:SH2 domain-containing protein [Lipomyces tetrasporus]|uniref:Transcription elongation factor Spt6 n=1 Tax=Lipomyces tetrasporus TaxID=54092 RepID=A0AAD7QML5_9ASCO|nr:SH2 domain-containing protein [Lipomyces tetrasporus]KAJ8097964.1 SH2 domain-containing protein [Lipomyces tetrasporus]